MSILICPVCGEKLDISGNSYKCANRHCFDIARSGYVNLLLPKHSVKVGHGDNKLMVQARRSFLKKGYYSRLCEGFCDMVEKHFRGGTVLDAGCGEGYYTAAMCERLKMAEIYGIDISKTAVEAAAKRKMNITFAAASVFHIPAGEGSCDMLTTLFAPYCGEEYRRVLRSGGTMIMVIPSGDHLWELKQAVYDEPYKNQVRPYELEGFELAEKQRITYKIQLGSAEDIQALFMMTPYYYHTGREQQERLAALENLETTADFEILAYIRTT